MPDPKNIYSVTSKDNKNFLLKFLKQECVCRMKNLYYGEMYSKGTLKLSDS